MELTNTMKLLALSFLATFAISAQAVIIDLDDTQLSSTGTSIGNVIDQDTDVLGIEKLIDAEDTLTLEGTFENTGMVLVQELIVNQSGVDWDSYEIVLEHAGIGTDAIAIVPIAALLTPVVGPVTNPMGILSSGAHLNNTLTFFDTIGAGSILRVDFFLDVTSDLDAFGWTLTQSPTLAAAGPPAVPEPTTLALFGLGLIGIGAARRKV